MADLNWSAQDDAEGCRETPKACEELGDFSDESETIAEPAELKFTTTYIED